MRHHSLAVSCRGTCLRFPDDSMNEECLSGQKHLLPFSQFTFHHIYHFHHFQPYLYTPHQRPQLTRTFPSQTLPNPSLHFATPRSISPLPRHTAYTSHPAHIPNRTHTRRKYDKDQMRMRHRLPTTSAAPSALSLSTETPLLPSQRHITS